MRPPAAWTASVMRRCGATCQREDSRLENGLSQPATLGEKPPVTINPTPPRARAAKYSASLSKSRA